MSVIVLKKSPWRKLVPTIRSVFHYADSSLVGAGVLILFTAIALSQFGGGHPFISLGFLFVAFALGAVAGVLLFRRRRAAHVRGVMLLPIQRISLLFVLFFIPILTLYLTWPTGLTEKDQAIKDMEEYAKNAYSLIDEAQDSLLKFIGLLDKARGSSGHPDAVNIAIRFPSGAIIEKRSFLNSLKEDVENNLEMFISDPTVGSRPYQVVKNETSAKVRKIKKQTDEQIGALEAALNKEAEPGQVNFDQEEVTQAIEKMDLVLVRLDKLGIQAEKKGLETLIQKITITVASGKALQIDVINKLSEAKAAYNRSNRTDVSVLNSIKKQTVPSLLENTVKLNKLYDESLQAIIAAPIPKKPFGVDTNKYRIARAKAQVLIQTGQSQADEASERGKDALYNEIQQSVSEWGKNLQVNEQSFLARQKAYFESGQTDESAVSYLEEAAPRELEVLIKQWDEKLTEWRKKMPRPNEVTRTKREPSDFEKVLYTLVPVTRLLGGGDRYDRVVTLVNQTAEGEGNLEMALNEALGLYTDPIDMLGILKTFRSAADHAASTGRLTRDQYRDFVNTLEERRQRILTEGGGLPEVAGAIQKAVASGMQTSCDDLRDLLKGEGRQFSDRRERSEVENVLMQEPIDVQNRFWFGCLKNVKVVGE